jgi:hypothetical protein
MIDVPTATLFVSIVGELWVSVNIGFLGAQITNERRDVVMTGYDGKSRLSIRHRRLMLINDWLPMTLANGFTCLAMAISIIVLPFIVDVLSFSRFYSIIAALPPGLGSISLLGGAFYEYQTMDEILEREELTARSAGQSGNLSCGPSQ